MDLTSKSLTALGLVPTDLIDTDGSHYPFNRGWAEAIQVVATVELGSLVGLVATGLDFTANVGDLGDFSTIGWFWFDSSVYAAGWNPHGRGWFEAANASVAITLWAFLGLESACANTDAVENPEKNVPIAVLGGTLGAAVIYIVSTNVIAGIVENAELAASTAPFGLVFAKMFSPAVGNLVMGLMVLVCIGSLLGW